MSSVENTRNNYDIEIIIKYESDSESIDVNLLNEDKMIKGFRKNILKDEVIIVYGNRINLGKHIFDNFVKYTQLSIIDYNENLPILIMIQNNDFLIKKINNTFVDKSVYDIIEDIGLTSCFLDN